MPIRIRKQGSRFVVSHPGGTLGRHSSRAKAEAQRRAIEASKRRRARKGK